jgi:hypothetical protein
MSDEIAGKIRRMSPTGQRKVFNTLLKRALRRKGISISMLAERLGVEKGTAQHWFYGVHLPPSKYAAPLADALDTPNLERWLDATRTRHCVLCGGIFRLEGYSGIRKYCSDDCRRAATKSAKKTFSGGKETELLFIFKRSVAAFCHACAQDPVCPDVKCELRPVSPLKTAEDLEIMRPKRRNTKWTPERKQAHSEHMKKIWSNPDEREKRIAKTRAGVAALGPAAIEDRARKGREQWAALSEEEKKQHAERASRAMTEARARQRKKLQEQDEAGSQA